MFRHIFINRLKCLLRDKQMIFWTFFFPLLLATLFGATFNTMSPVQKFDRIKIAVVNNASYRNNQAFQQALSSVSNRPTSSGPALFSVTLASKEKADESLKNNQIAGYILFDPDARLIVKEPGLNQTILKGFMDTYLQTNSTFTTILRQNREAAPRLISAVSEDRSYLQEVIPGRGKPNETLIYYYALIGMACLYGGFWGMKEVTAVQADLSPQGARLNLAPVHKSQLFGYALCAATVVHLLSIFTLLAYLSLVLKVDFGGRLGYTILACTAGSLTGVSMGAVIGALVKKGEGVKIAVLISVSMAFAFLAGMMFAEMKYMVTNAVPAMAYINPANLIADAFYSLYYYHTLTRFWLNIGLLFGYTAFFYLLTFLVMRRKQYASL